MHNERLYDIWLASCAPTGSALAFSLLKYFGCARRVWEAGETELAEAPVEWRNRMAPFLNKDLDYALRVLDYCETNGVGITTLADPFYPRRLRDLPSPPLLFYHVGNFFDLDESPCVTVVGTRQPSGYGERATKRLAVDLARGGATIVSGLARGIDGISHRAALWCETPTVGVLGCGIDRIYPPEHRDLIAEVGEKGLLVSEYAPGTPPHAKNFPMRNRLLAALSPVTLVVEASASSGSLITAEYALRLRRELFTVPGPIFSATGAGTNHLLRVGAKPALRAEDVLASLRAQFAQIAPATPVPRPSPRKRASSARAAHFSFPGSGHESLPPEFSKSPPQHLSPQKRRFEKCSVLELTDEERELVSRLSCEPVLLETLAGEEWSVSALMRLVSSLEIKGYVERVSGNRFCLVDEAE